MKLTWDFTGKEYQLLELETNKTLAAIKYNGEVVSMELNINWMHTMLQKLKKK